jgi:hypothetical protein
MYLDLFVVVVVLTEILLPHGNTNPSNKEGLDNCKRHLLDMDRVFYW